MIDVSFSKEDIQAAIREAFAPVVRQEYLKGKPLLTTEEAAEYYGIGKGTLEKRRTNGLPPTYRKIGGGVFYTHEDLKNCIERGLVKTKGGEI